MTFVNNNTRIAIMNIKAGLCFSTGSSPITQCYHSSVIECLSTYSWYFNDFFLLRMSHRKLIQCPATLYLLIYRTGKVIIVI